MSNLGKNIPNVGTAEKNSDSGEDFLKYSF